MSRFIAAVVLACLGSGAWIWVGIHVFGWLFPDGPTTNAIIPLSLYASGFFVIPALLWRVFNV